MSDKLMPQFEVQQEYLVGRLSEQRPPRLAVHVALDLAQSPVSIVKKLTEAAASVGQRLQAAYQTHLANISDEAQVLATKLTYAEINRIAPATQADMVRQGKDASVVAEAAMGQRRIAPKVQSTLVEHCKQHACAMRALASRPEATVDTLGVLAVSQDPQTRSNVVRNFAPRMRMEEQGLNDKKAAILNALIERYESDDAPYLVPVCQDSEQLGEMYEKTSKTLGMVSAFVDNPYTPDSVLMDIASSPRMQIVQREAAIDARRVLMVRVNQRESSSNYEDMAPS